MSQSPIDAGVELVRTAARAHVPLRLFGGVAIWLRSGERTRSSLGRDYADVDLVGHRRGSRELRELLEAAGYLPDREFNATQGATRLLYHAPDGAFHVDIFLDRFSMSHSLDFESRLEIEPDTLTAADLLLAKLQVAEVNHKDLTDTAMLLVDHRIGDTDDSDTLNGAYVSEVCASDWGLFTTAGDNLDAVERVLPELPLDDAQRATVGTAIPTLRDKLERAPKSRSWKLRAKVGRRKRWYEVPDETIR